MTKSKASRGSEPARVGGRVLPFPSAPTASFAGPTLASSTHVRRDEPAHLPADAPNVLVILLDDVGFGLPASFGGEIDTPTLTRLRDTGISYNRFHTTAVCSPTRAALLTGRNHHRVCSGTIAERALDWDGYSGVIPKTSATMAEVLHHYGYKTCAFGKWHNTPTQDVTPMGPFDRWPTGHGFDYFYGFIGGETSQWEPRLFENTTPIEPPRHERYHLSEDLSARAIEWLHKHRAYAPDKPFFMYWAPGAAHGPHHVFKEYADKYAGRFDDGWDAYRERVFARQKAQGWIPSDAQLTPRAESMPAWSDIPEAERPFQRRLMEVFAGFVEHVDVQAGKLLDELESFGLRDNTLVFYVFGDNGSSAEGQRGTVSELLAQNGIPSSLGEQLKTLEELGGLDVLGSPLVDNMYHAGWAWAGDTPFHHTKLIASHFGGTRNPLVISWPKRIAPDAVPRSQFHHVNDIAVTVYDLIGIRPPDVVDGQPQDPLDGVSMAYTFDDAAAASTKHVQYFENNGSRGIYLDGWYACTFGPLIPWAVTGDLGIADWNPDHDVWELYDLKTDFTQARNLASERPERLATMKRIFFEQAAANKALPIGAGLWTRLHPEDRIHSPYTEWHLDASTTRMPEFAAPGLGRQDNHVTIDADFDDAANGVLYALGGNAGGLALFVDDGHLVYEYNMMLVERYTARADAKIAKGQHRIEVDTRFPDRRRAGIAQIVVKLDGQPVAQTTVERTVPLAFSATETLDVGQDLGSAVSLAYYERAPFAFSGTIHAMTVRVG